MLSKHSGLRKDPLGCMSIGLIHYVSVTATSTAGASAASAYAASASAAVAPDSLLEVQT